MSDSEDRQRKIDKAMEGVDLDQFFDGASTPLDGMVLAYKEMIATFEKHEFNHKDAMYLSASVMCNTPGTAPG